MTPQISFEELKIQGKVYPGWWDGPRRFEYVNRNIITWAQRETLFNLLTALSGPICIDIGGPGFMLEDKRVFGLNIAKGDHITADGSCLPFLDNSVDLIVSSHALEHIHNTDQTLREWVRVIKPGGFIACIMPDKRYFLHTGGNIHARDDAPNEMEPEELREKLLSINGIEIILFDTRKNNFDFEFVVRKEKK